MSSKLTWTFTLLDRFSAPANRAAKSVAAFEQKLDKTTGTGKRHDLLLKQIEKNTRSVGSASRSAGEGVGSFTIKLGALIYTARTALSVVQGLSGGLLRIGTMGVKAASFKESTMLGLNMMLRDPKKAKALYGEAVNFADISPFETEPTLKWYRQLVAAMGDQATVGLGTPGGSRTLKILSGLGDIASTQPNPGEAMDRILLQITQMMNKGRMLGNDLRPLAESGVPLGLVYEKLAKKHGITVGEARSQKWEGKFGAGEGLTAILEASAERYGGGVLGGGMGPASRTTQGLWSTLKSRPYRMMEDIGDTAGFQSMKKALENLANVLDPATPTGARIKANVELLFDKLLGGVFKKFEDPKAVEAWVDGLVRGFEKLIPKVGEFADKVGSIAASFAKIDKFITIWPNPVSAVLDARSDKAKTASGAVQPGEAGVMAAIYGRLSAKPDRTWLEDLELRNARYYLETHGMTPPSATPAEKKPTGMNLQGGIHIHINGAQDPRAVGDEVEDRLAIVVERWAIQAGA